MANDEKLYIRLPKDLKEEFIKVLVEQDYTASQVLRRCIKDYINKYKEESSKEGK